MTDHCYKLEDIFFKYSVIVYVVYKSMCICKLTGSGQFQGPMIVATSIISKWQFSSPFSDPPRFDKSEEGDENPRLIKLGETVKFTCVASGFPPPITVWTKDTRPLVFTDNL